MFSFITITVTITSSSPLLINYDILLYNIARQKAGDDKK